MVEPVSSAARALAIVGSTMKHTLSRRAALPLFAVVVVMWGSNWAITKTLVQSVSPLWTAAIRSAIATVALFVLLLARGQFVRPRRCDIPVILTVALLHMGWFSAIVTCCHTYIMAN